MTTMTGLREVLSVIEALLAGDPSKLSLLDDMADRSDLPREVGSAVHQLMHYVADADIRARETEYEEYWRHELEAMRDRLRSL